jgi:hypothetical protein
MSPSLKNTEKRSFTINNAYHVDGCKTKFSHKDYTGRFIKISAQRAASSALTQLCHVKRIRGQCTLYIEMRETTQGSKHKLYGYHCKRIKYTEPVMRAGIAFNYYNKCKRVRIPSEKCAKSHKSSGRMKYYKHKSSSKLSKSYKSSKSSKSSKASKSSKSKLTKKSVNKPRTKKGIVNTIMDKLM